MEEFTTYLECAKCGSEGAIEEYTPSNEEYIAGGLTVPAQIEHLLITCSICHYTWKIKCIGYI